MTRLRELGEFGLIRRLAAGLRAGDEVRVGPGDDAAVVRPEAGRELVVTTDAFVAGRHWLDAWMAPEVLGARLALANLSDLAAMAARPRWAVLSLGLSPDRDSTWIEGVQAGLAAQLALENASLVGGNVTAVDGADWLSLTLLGDVLPAMAWTRAGARAGDTLAITGHPGRAGAALALVRALGERAGEPEWGPLLAAWRAPASRVDFARTLAASGAVRAAVDISDGVAGDLAHLCAASGVGAVFDCAAWGEDAPLEAAARALGADADALRVGPSDDYELLLAVDPDRAGACETVAREAGVPWRTIGSFTAGSGAIEWVRSDGRREPLAARGFDHFA